MLMATTAVVGRDAELERLTAFVRALPAGPAGLVLEGEAGVGKTIVWEEALAYTAGDAWIVVSRPVQSEMALSYAALGDLIGDAVREGIDLPEPQRRALDVALALEDQPGESTDHRAVAAAVLTVLVSMSQEQPLVVAVDDLQWIDRSSARALGFAFRRLASEPIGLLATLRTAPGVEVSSELADLFRDHRLQRLRVGPLSVGAIQHLLADRFDLALPRTALVSLHERARGNAFFALELGRALVDAGSLPEPGEPLPVPGDLQALLGQRVRRLPAPTRDALLLAAVLAEPDEGVLSLAFGSGWPDAIARGREEGIVDIDDRTVRFVHPLIAGVVATAASDGERRDAHRRLAEAVDDEHVRARHLALAATRPDEAVAAALEAAALDTARRGAPDSAAELAELSGRLTPPDHAHDVCRRCTIAGEARFAAGDSGRAVELFTEAVAAAAAGPERGGVLWRLAWVRFHHDDPAASRATLEQAAEEAGDDLALRAAIDHDLAYAWLAMGDAVEDASPRGSSRGARRARGRDVHPR